MWLEENRMDVRVADVLYRVRPRLVVHDVSVRDIGFHRVVTYIDPYFATLDEVYGLIRMGMLGVLVTDRERHFDDPRRLIVEKRLVLIVGYVTGVYVGHGGPRFMSWDLGQPILSGTAE
jgi:hypothetical protein